MIGNYWTNSKKLCDEFNLMRVSTENNNNNIVLVDDVIDTKDIDYYIIINKPLNDKIYYDPSKTLIF